MHACIPKKDERLKGTASPAALASCSKPTSKESWEVQLQLGEAPGPDVEDAESAGRGERAEDAGADVVKRLDWCCVGWSGASEPGFTVAMRGSVPAQAHDMHTLFSAETVRAAYKQAGCMVLVLAVQPGWSAHFPDSLGPDVPDMCRIPTFMHASPPPPSTPFIAI
eukprot:1162003-Pelagomonas_calceolata.AAC.4